MRSFFLILLIAIGLTSYGQKNAIKFHASQKTRLKLQYERMLNNDMSVGLVGSGFYLLYSGVKLEPYFRYYFTPNATGFNGAFLQLKGHYTNALDNTEYREIFEEYGASFSIGYQHKFCKRWLMDTYLGYRGTHFVYPSTSESASAFRSLYSTKLEFGLSIGRTF